MKETAGCVCLSLSLYAYGSMMFSYAQNPHSSGDVKKEEKGGYYVALARLYRFCSRTLDRRKACAAHLKKKRRKIYYITLNVKNVLCEELRRAKEKRTTSNGKRQQQQTGGQRRKCSRLVFPPPLRSVAFFLLQSSLDCRYLL